LQKKVAIFESTKLHPCFGHEYDNERYKKMTWKYYRAVHPKMTKKVIQDIINNNTESNEIDITLFSNDIQVGKSSFIAFNDKLGRIIRERGFRETVTISKPGFNIDRDRAFVIAATNRGMLNGEGYLFVFKRSKGKWVFRKFIRIWMQ
jgi:hypothetical protein